MDVHSLNEEGIVNQTLIKTRRNTRTPRAKQDYEEIH